MTSLGLVRRYSMLISCVKRQTIQCQNHVIVPKRIFSNHNQDKISGGGTTAPTANNIDIENMEEKAESLTSLEQFREDMKPFMKEMFCGKFNDKVFSYPDVLTNDRYFNLENHLLEMRKCLEERSELVQRIGHDKRISKDILM